MLFSYIVNNPISSADVVLSASFSFFCQILGKIHSYNLEKFI